jgi:hypothetical protein
MDDTAIRDLLDRDKSIVELRALVAGYERRLSRNADRTPESHAALAHVPEPLFLLNDISIDLRSTALGNYAVVEAPTILDCSGIEEPEPFTFVYKVASGVFRVHPHEGRLTVAALGPFDGPVPTGLVATAQTTHEAAPPVRFHISTWSGEIDPGTVRETFGGDGQRRRFSTVPPRHPGFLISMAEMGSSASSSDEPWGLLLATMADPPDAVSYAWAEFSDIVLIFSSDRGSEVRLLS